MAVEDDDVRRACIDAAQREDAQPPRQQEQRVRPTAPQQQEETRPEQPEQIEAQPAQQVLEERLVRDQQPVRKDERAAGHTERDSDAPRMSGREPPHEWAGTVSRIYQSILDRQLIAVDGNYLFESDRAAHARLETGERVAVEKVSSRFTSGRKWRITGQSRTQIVAFRIRCERDDIRVNDRRKCTQMLDR